MSLSEELVTLVNYCNLCDFSQVGTLWRAHVDAQPVEMQVNYAANQIPALNFLNSNTGLSPPEAPSEKYKGGREEKTSYRTNGMLKVPGGTYKIGTDDQIIPADREGPAKLIELPPFYLDVHEVSNAEFNLFVEETRYKTEAENFGNSFVAEYYVSEEVKAAITQAVAAAPWWLPVQVPRFDNHRGL